MSGRDERTVLFELPSVISGTLVCTQGSVAGRSWSLTAGTFTIGRQAGSDLFLGAEPGVSKLHAKIQAEGDQYVIVDMESRNGTIVNGRPVQSKRLFDGDEVRVCGCVLRFTQSGASGPQPVSSTAAAAGFAEGGATSPESLGMTAEPPSVTDPSASQDSYAGVQPTTPQAPTAEWVPPAGVDPRAAATELAPLPEERYRSAAPWLVVGMVGVLLVGGGAWAGLRVLGDDLLGPLPSGDELAGRADAGVGSQGGDAGTAVAALAGKDAGALAVAADAGDVGGDDGDLDDGEDAGEDAADPDATKPDTTKPDATKPDTTKPDTTKPDTTKPDTTKPDTTKPDTTKPPPAVASGPSEWFNVAVDKPGLTAVKSKVSGTIGAVNVTDGDIVKKGAAILTLEGSGGADPDEISNLKASIESLEEIAESQPSAKDMLEQEKAKLARLQAKSKTPKVVAPAAGAVTGLTMTAGASIATGDVVCSIRRAGAPTASITVPSKDGRRARRGAKVELELQDGGSATGKVKSSRRRGSKYTVVLDVGEASLDDVTRARFP